MKIPKNGLSTICFIGKGHRELIAFTKKRTKELLEIERKYKDLTEEKIFGLTTESGKLKSKVKIKP